jgi:YbbR domain-containing protein
MFRWLTQNYRTFLWAFALSLAVWISAVTSADPDETGALPFIVPIETLGGNTELMSNEELPTEARITIRAPRSVWNMIEADPELVHAILDLSGLSSGEHELELQIQVNVRPVQVVSVVPNKITLTLEPYKSETLDVSLDIAGEAALGYQVGDAAIEPAQVIVSGAESLVQKVKRTQVLANIDGLRENFDQTLIIEAVDENGQIVEGVDVVPQMIHVALPVSQQGGYRDVAVKVVVIGQVASGYRLTDISVIPPVVTVFAGDQQLINNLPGVLETQILDLQNVQEDINTRVGLNLPDGVTMVGEQTVLIKAGVSPIESSVTLAGEVVEIFGLDSGLSAAVSPITVDVILSGPLPLLDTLNLQDVHVTVDLTGLGVGTHQIVPKIEVLTANVVVESVLPNTIEVVITLLGTPTITPTP